MGKGWTFQWLIDKKMTVTAYCHTSANLKTLCDRIGPDASPWMGHPAEASLQEMQRHRSRPDLHSRHQPDRVRQGEGQLTEADAKADIFARLS